MQRPSLLISSPFIASSPSSPRTFSPSATMFVIRSFIGLGQAYFRRTSANIFPRASSPSASRQLHRSSGGECFDQNKKCETERRSNGVPLSFPGPESDGKVSQCPRLMLKKTQQSTPAATKKHEKKSDGDGVARVGEGIGKVTKHGMSVCFP